MENCSGKKHAIVSIYGGGKKASKVYVPDPPVNVSERFIPGMDGGQCKCVAYVIEFEITYTEHSLYGDYPGQKQSTSFGAIGAIDNLKTKQTTQGYYGYINFYVDISIDCPVGNEGTEANFFNFIFADYRFGIWREVTSMRFFFYRQDGQPDNCGSSPDKCEIIVKGAKAERFKMIYIGKCPKFDVKCDDDCPDGMHKDKTGKCCCDNEKDLRKLASDIKSSIARIK